MPESRSHKKGKGSAMHQEVPIPGNRRLDALRGNSAIEVERGSTPQSINKALSRLHTQFNKSKILRVPQEDMDMSAKLARDKNMHITVTNLSKTKRTKTYVTKDENQLVMRKINTKIILGDCRIVEKF